MRTHLICHCEEHPLIPGSSSVNGGGKVDHMGGPIVGLRRWKTVPPATFYKPQSTEDMSVAVC